MTIKEIATAVSCNFNTNNQKECLNAMVALYRETNGSNGRKLIDLDAQDCQSVGLAFAKMALFFDNGDSDINSVAAENAYYCLAKSYIYTENRFVLPAVFTLLNDKRLLLSDKLISNWSDMAQKQVGMPIGLMLEGNPFTDTKLQGFRDQAIGFSAFIQFYVLNIFYDLDKGEFLIPTDLPYCLPSKSDINCFLDNLNIGIQAIERHTLKKEGEKHFSGVYKQCEETLMKF